MKGRVPHPGGPTIYVGRLHRQQRLRLHQQRQQKGVGGEEKVGESAGPYCTSLEPTHSWYPRRRRGPDSIGRVGGGRQEDQGGGGGDYLGSLSTQRGIWDRHHRP